MGEGGTSGESYIVSPRARCDTGRGDEPTPTQATPDGCQEGVRHVTWELVTWIKVLHTTAGRTTFARISV